MDARKINLWSSLLPLTLTCLLGLGLGALVNKPAWGLGLGVLIYHAYVLHSLQRFKQWALYHIDTPPPDFDSNLNVIAYSLYQSTRQERQAHQQMLQLMQKIRASLSALSDAVLLVDQRDCIEWWNPSAQHLLGLNAPDQGRHILTVIRQPMFHQYYQNPSHYSDGVRLSGWQNHARFIQCEVTPFGQEKLLILYDVTRLQHLEQMRKDFVANVSHELRTPLTVIMGYVETLSEQPDLDERWQRALLQMTQQSQRMNSIINDLLLLSRLENDEKPSTPRQIDMPKLLMQLFDDAQMYNKTFDHLIHLHLDSQQQLMGYEDYLRSALSNLITNAIKYTPKGGEINISWEKTENGARFCVQDNGIGIAPQHIARLTERFYRVDTGRSRETGGTGLGLAIVKHVLYQHSAELDIESNIGQGSTFSVLFPESILV